MIALILSVCSFHSVSDDLIISCQLYALPICHPPRSVTTMKKKHVHFSPRARVAVVEHSPQDSISYSTKDYRAFRKQALMDVASYHRDNRERNRLGRNPDAASVVGLENYLCKNVFERVAIARSTHRRAVLEAQGIL